MVMRLTGRQIFAVNGTRQPATTAGLSRGTQPRRLFMKILRCYNHGEHRDHGEENTENRNTTEQNEINVGQLTQGIKCSRI